MPVCPTVPHAVHQDHWCRKRGRKSGGHGQATVFACLPESTEEGKLLLRNIAEHPWLARSGRMLLEYLIAEREKAHFDEDEDEKKKFDAKAFFSAGGTRAAHELQ